ncbi:MAG: heavy metal-associated domain-containing protein [Candidatus Eremiobacterota bacterium]
MGRLEGVQSLQIDLQANLVVIQPRPGVALDLKAIPEAIRQAGYQPGEMQLTATGRVQAGTFLVPGWQPLPILGPAPPDGERVLRARVDLSTRPPGLTPLP